MAHNSGQCSFGENLDALCETEYSFFNVTTWTKQKLALLQNRLQAELKNDITVPLATCCTKHWNQFGASYEEHQESTSGCCIGPHLIPKTTSTRKITDAIHDILRKNYPYALIGRQICNDCWTQAKTPLTLLPDAYNFDEVNEIYKMAVSLHQSPLESDLKDFQAQTLHPMLKGKDVICVLRTNYGKTLPMIAASLIKAKISKKTSITLIISPLRSLMDDLLERLQKWNLSGYKVKEKSLSTGELKHTLDALPTGTAAYILTAPEKLPECRELLSSAPVDFICVDECHVTSDWAEEFRTEYGNIHEIRQYLQCPMVLFTATLSRTSKSAIVRNTGINLADVVEISDSPDRPEIFLEIRKCGPFEDAVKFLAAEINENQQKAPKTVFFARSIRKTHHFNVEFRELLENRGRVEKDDVLLEYRSEHFSASTEKHAKARIMADFCSKDGYIKVLFSTISYGMGIDNKLIRRVVVWGGDSEASCLWQKISRACRDGEKGTAILYQPVSKTSLIIPDTCIRHCILKDFVGYIKPLRLDNPESFRCAGDVQSCEWNYCCSVCSEKCICMNV